MALAARPLISAAAAAVPPAEFDVRPNAYCRFAAHEVRLPSEQACSEHCANRRVCQCFHFHGGKCRFTFAYSGLVSSSTAGFVAHVRQGTEEVGPSRSESSSRSGAACGPSLSVKRAPLFYMYDGPQFEWSDRLSACFEALHGVPAWAFATNDTARERSGAPPQQLAHSLWLHSVLRDHPRRVRDPTHAGLFFVPAFGALSAAAGPCAGQTHEQRMVAAAQALGSAPAFTKSARRHAVLASGMAGGRDVLGALGQLLANASGIALCVDRQNCAPGFQKKAATAPLPLAPLASMEVRTRVTQQACSPRRRRYTLFFRGAHARGHNQRGDSQEIRSRLWALRALNRSSIKFVRSARGPTLRPEVQRWLREHGWTKDIRLAYNTMTYVSGVLHSDFCIVIRGDSDSAARQLVDAVAGGCVPVVVGDKVALPFSRSLRYGNFTVRVGESDFLRDPLSTVRAALDAAAPRLKQLRANVAAAREGLLLAFGSAPRPDNMTAARGADLALLELGRTVCPRAPSTLRACDDETPLLAVQQAPAS